MAAPLDTDEARIAACRQLTTDGRAEVVALTLGDQGALLVTRDKAFRSQPVIIEPVSTVGAGDSFLGGLVSALASGQSLYEAFRVAVAAGSAAALSPGTELCSEQDVQRLLLKVKVSEVTRAPA